MPQIGDYDLIAKLGQGGMGAVYKARQISLDRIVALKVLEPNLALNQDSVTRFLREARATAKLNHPNIIAGVDVGSADGYHFFAMEFVEGESLRGRIESRGALPEDEVLRIGAAVASALAHAHEVGIVHRDVKPDNILMAPDGTPKLADLGLAKAGGQEDGSLTQSGMVVGTPHYMAPEQAAGQTDIDGRADTYALGCTLYHAATGKTPFEAPTTAVLMVKHLQEKMPHPQTLKRELSDGFCLVLSRMLAPKREDRYATMREAAEDLEAVASGAEPACKPLPPSKSKFQPPPSGPKFDRRSGRHAPITAEPLGGESRSRIAAHKTESKTKPVQRQKPNWVPAAAAGGAVVLILIAYLLMFGGSKEPANPSSKNAAATSTKKKDPHSEPIPPRVQPTVQPGPAVQPQPVPGVQLQPGPQPVRPAPLPPAVNVPVDGAVFPPLGSAPPPLPADAALLLKNGDMSEWKIGLPTWRAEGETLIGTQEDGKQNASIWRWGLLKQDFDLSFDCENSTEGFHFGWSHSEGKPMGFVRFPPEGRAILYLYPPTKELDTTTAVYKHGRHNWRVICKDAVILVYIDGALALRGKTDLGPAPRRDLGIFTPGRTTIRLSRILLGTPGPLPVAAPAPLPGSVEEQIAQLTARLKSANPDWPGKLEHKVENGAIVELSTHPKGLRDLTPFRSLPSLKRLLLNGDNGNEALSDLRPLKGLPLNHLELYFTSVKDLSPLVGMPLANLRLSSTPVSDLTPLKGMALETLDISGTKVTDLSPLKGMQLKNLFCFANNDLTDLTPLSGLPLEMLYCGWTGIKDLTPLASISTLKVLIMGPIQTDDLTPLKKLKLKALSLDYKHELHEKLLREMTTLEAINGMAADEFRTRAANGTLPK